MATQKRQQLERTAGYFALTFAVCCATLFYWNLRAQHLSGAPRYTFLGWIALYAFVAAVGLLKQKTWGVVPLFPPLFFCGIVVPVFAVAHDPHPETISFAAGWCAIIIIPTVSMLRSWNRLN